MGLPTTQDWKEQIRDAVDIVELIASYVSLARRGNHYLGLCPFHDDSRPSLNVNPERQTYRCWACGAGGDVFAFVMKRESVGFREALLLLADRAGIPVPGESGHGSSTHDSHRKRQYQVLAWAANRYHEYLLSSPRAESARNYLATRGLEPGTIGKFRLGYAPAEWSWLRDQANPLGYADGLLEEVGLVARSDAGKRPYDRFRDRLMFPIHDMQGRVIAFGGRVLPGAGADQQAKYINSPETPLFKKAHQLFGLPTAREVATRAQEIIVVEGYTDVIMAWQMGIANVVAVLGTALGDRHLHLLQRLVPRVVLVLDGDAAGRKRANEVLNQFLASSLDVRIATLPEDLDPCDFLSQRGVEAFRHLTGDAPDPLFHKLRQLTSDIDVTRDVHSANAALDEMLALIAQIPTADRAADARQIMRVQHALGLIARTFRVEAAHAERRLQELRSRTKSMATGVIAAEPPLDPWDLELLALLSFAPQLVVDAQRQIPGHFLSSAAGRTVYDLWLQTFAQRGSVSLADVLLATEDSDTKQLLVQIDEYATRHANVETPPAKVLEELLKAYRRRGAERNALGAVADLDIHQLSETEQIEALTRLVEQQREYRGISAPTDG